MDIENKASTVPTKRPLSGFRSLASMHAKGGKNRKGF